MEMLKVRDPDVLAIRVFFSVSYEANWHCEPVWKRNSPQLENFQRCNEMISKYPAFREMLPSELCVWVELDSCPRLR